MRYTKELQMAVVEDIQGGMNAAAAAAKYNIPEDVALRWANLDYSFERAKEAAMHCYSPLIGETEADITNDVAECVNCSSMDDDAWDKFCQRVFKRVFNCAAKVVQSERRTYTSNSTEKDVFQHMKVFNKVREKNKAAFIEAAEIGKDFALSLS